MIIWLIDGSLTDTTTPDQSSSGRNSKDGGLFIPRSSRTGFSWSNGLVLYSGYSMGLGSYLSAEVW